MQQKPGQLGKNFSFFKGDLVLICDPDRLSIVKNPALI